MRYFDRHRKRLTKHHYIRGTLKSAEGENEVKIEDSAGVPFNKVEIAGNTSQKQYQGYQLFQFKDYSTSLTDTDGNVLTWEMKDGVVTINGIQNEFSFVTLDSKCVTSSTLEAGTYSFTASYYRDGGTAGGCDWRFRYSSDTTTIGIGSYTHGINKTVETKTFDEPFYFRYAQFYLVANKEYKDFKFTIGLFKGSYTGETMPPYEPYVGGIPSPNPGQKIPIYSTSESTVTLNTELEASEITYDSNFLYTIAFEHPFSFNGAESLTLSVDSFYTGNMGDMLIVGGDPSHIIGGSGTFDYIAAGDGSRGEVTIHSSGYGDTFYIGIGNTDTGISSDKIEEYRQLAITTPITATGTITTQTGVREIPAYPQEIENANSEGMSVTLYGDNLFNQELLLTDTDFTKEEYNGEECIKVVANVNAHTFPCEIPIGKMSVSFEISHPKTGGNFSVTLNYEDGSGEYREYTNNNPKTDFYKFSIAKTTTKKIVKIIITFWNIWNMRPYYIKNFMVNTGEPKPYEPYFREEIAIPTSVEVEGAIVDLRLAHIPNLLDWRGTTATDYLKVDKVANKVEYVQGIGKVILDNNTEFSYSTARPNVFSALPFLENTVNFGNSAYCNKYQIYIGVGNILNLDYAFSTDGRYYGGQLSRISIKDIRFDNVADFKADLEQSPIEVLYCLETPITHDITSTELGQALLRLCVDRGLDGTLRVESELGISSLSCDYYSQENEDKVLLTVSYQNEAGDALMNDKTHNVRRGSKYQIVSPQIDGYEPSEKEVFGIADGDLTIILKYKEVSDVTV